MAEKDTSTARTPEIKCKGMKVISKQDKWRCSRKADKRKTGESTDYFREIQEN